MWSTPISEPIGTLGGIVAGEVASYATKEVVSFCDDPDRVTKGSPPVPTADAPAGKEVKFQSQKNQATESLTEDV